MSNLTLAVLDMFTGYSDGGSDSVLYCKAVILVFTTAVLLWRILPADYPGFNWQIVWSLAGRLFGSAFNRFIKSEPSSC